MKTFLLTTLLMLSGLTQAQTQAPDSEDLLRRAGTALREGQSVRAMVFLERALEQTPGRYEVHLLSSLVLLDLGELEAAGAAAAQALELGPPEAQDRLRPVLDELERRRAARELEEAARAAARGNRLAKAADLYTRAWTRHPEAPELGLSAASSWAAIGEHHKARAIARLLAAAPDLEPDLRSRASELEAATTEIVQREYARLLELGKAAAKKGDDRVARAAFERASTILPEGWRAEVELAAVRLRIESPAASLASLTRAIENGALLPAEILERSDLAELHAYEPYAELMLEVFGPEALERARAGVRLGRALERVRSGADPALLEDLDLDPTAELAVWARAQEARQGTELARRILRWRAVQSFLERHPGCGVAVHPPTAELEEGLKRAEAALARGWTLPEQERHELATLLERHEQEAARRQASQRQAGLLHVLQLTPTDPEAAVVAQHWMSQLPADRLARDARLLNRAARAGQATLCRRLLEAGADPNAYDRANFFGNRELPLISALRSGSRETVEVLLRAGADPDRPGTQGRHQETVRPRELARAQGWGDLLARISNR